MQPWRASADLSILRVRAQLLERIRSFFRNRNVLEVTTPVLSRAGNTDPNLESYQTSRASAWLRTSPEFFHKRLLASHGRDIYEMGPVFRQGEAGLHHNPEFTMLEWYRVGWDYRELAEEVVALVRMAGDGRFDDWPAKALSYQELFQHYTGLDPHTVDSGALAERCREYFPQADSLSRNELLDLLLTHDIQTRLPPQGITTVFDYPPAQAALARVQPGSPPLAQRFEIYLGRQELANGYQELTDAGEQRRRFQKDNEQRREAGLSAVEMDENLLAALVHGLPECAGVALGVDRLLMAIAEAESIAEVIAFPSSRA